MAINLCDQDKYYTDSQLSNAAERKPRATEDIQIIGSVNQDETIDLSTCADLTTISSISIDFYNYTNSITISANQPGGLSSSNVREPEPDVLALIQSENPLRYEHGWYTIDGTYAVKHIATNAITKLNNVGFNNEIGSAYKIELNNSCYANGTMSADTIKILSDSRMYGATLQCNDLEVKDDSKIDSMAIANEKTTIDSVSLAEFSLATSSIDSQNSKFIDGSIYFTQGKFVSDIIASEIVDTSTAALPSRITAFTNPVTFTNCTFTQNSLAILSSSHGSNNTWCGDATIKVLYDGPQTVISGGVLKVDLLDTATSNNFTLTTGTLQINSFSGITTTQITSQGGKIEAGLSAMSGYKLQITNQSGIVIIHNSGNIDNFTNTDGYAEGDIANCTNFNNTLSGIINIAQCIVTNGSNDGKMLNVSGTSFTNNASGAITNAILMDGSSNLGTIQQGLFYETSSNNSEGYVFNGSFYNTSSNNAFVDNAIFYDTSTNNGTGNNSLFYNTSSNNGSCSGAVFYSGSINNSINVNQANFYEISKNLAAISGEANFYDNAVCLSAFGSGISATFYDYSSATGSSLNSGYVSFQDDSRCDTFTLTSGSLSFVNNSTALNLTIAHTGLPYVTFRDSTKVEDLLGDGPAFFYDNAVSKKNIQNSGTVFLGSSSHSGTTAGTVQYTTFRETSYHTGVGISTATEVWFRDSSRNQAPINGGTNVYFYGGAINKKPIKQLTKLSFIDGSINASGGDILNISTVEFDNSSSLHNGTISCPTLLATNNSILYPISYTGIPTATIASNNILVSGGSYNNYILNSSNITFHSSTNGVSNTGDFSWNVAQINASNVNFLQGSSNFGQCNASVITFSGGSTNYSNLVNGNTTFINSSNNGIINGTVILTTSQNNNTINGNTTGSGSINNGVIKGEVSFIDCANGGRILGDGTFDQYSINNSIITGTISFTNYSVNNGVIHGSATFDATSTNNGQIISQ